jgi:hypothetical protein
MCFNIVVFDFWTGSFPAGSDPNRIGMGKEFSECHGFQKKFGSYI